MQTFSDINYNTLNGQVDWYCQGNGGGDCRLFALLEGLSRSKGFTSLNDYVTITQNDDEYNVTFKNYTRGQNSVTITKSDLNNFANVHGDIDVVLIDKALNILFEPYGKTVETVAYQTLNEYIFGNRDITYINNWGVGTFKTALTELWDSYKNGDINNVTVGINSTIPVKSIGILASHAYTLANLTDSTITLINPWDNKDSLTIDLTVLYQKSPCLIVYNNNFYGYDYIDYDEELWGIHSSNISLSNINNDIAAWISYNATYDPNSSIQDNQSINDIIASFNYSNGFDE